MRILKLRLHNLNSLTGGWEIDFTAPAFADGIFAITGPTGAGKSTILDALCLALYGCTPRLGKITQSDNEIMSRQSGDCFAEVEFSTGQGSFRCSWHQHRERKRPGGKLQQAKRELARTDGKIVAEKVKEVDDKIEELTGMDAKRFTRSMLLAQGGFAAFLQASQDERAYLLENITGEKIYTDISKQVHERCRVENNRQKQLEDQVKAFRLLSLDEEEAVRQELADLRNTEAEQKTKLDQIAAALAWLKRLAALRQELAGISAEQAGLATVREQFAASEQRLHLAGQALLLAGEYAALAALRCQQADDLKAAEILRSSLPELEATLKTADEQRARSSGALAASRTAQAQGQILIAKVRKLDILLQEKRNSLKKQDDDCAELRRKNAADLAVCGRHEQEIGRVQAGQQHSAAYLAAHQADERLLTELTGLCQMLKQLGELAGRYEKAKLDCARAEKTAAEKAQSWQSKAEELRQANMLLAEAKSGWETAEKERALLLQGRRIEELRQEQANLADLTGLLRQLNALAKDIAGLHEQQAANAAAKSRLAETLNALRQARDAARQEEETRRAVAAFASCVRGLEEERTRLQAGQPCPLCGSPDHPYAQGGLPLLDEAELAAQAAAAALRQAEEALNKADKEQARTEQAAQHFSDRLAEKNRAIQELQQRTANLCAGLALAPEHIRLAELEQRLAASKQAVQAADALAETISQLGKVLDQRQADHAKAAQAADKAAAAQDQAAAERQRLADQQTELAQELERNHQQAQAELAVYGIAELPLRNMGKLIDQLTARRDAWQRHQQQGVEAEKEIARLRTALTVLRAGIDHRNEQLEQAESQLQELRQKTERLADERAALFADKQPDAEEKRLAEAVHAAEEAAQQAQEKHRRYSDELKQQRTLISSSETSAANRKPELARQEAAFAVRLRASGFADEAAWQAARLTEAEQEALNKQAEDLRTRQAQLDERRRDRAARLADEEKLALTDLAPEQLEAQQAELAADCRRTAERTGSLNHQLLDNQERRGQQSSLLRELAAQQAECLRWKTLHDLIGSSDGKKYRNFAQGLTFEQMVAHANRQLARMSSRYQLVRDQNQPLELNVADSWQAGEIRSAKNLSGGESFVVSLALALGLSNMAGGKVESLFLDEGFGTLDDESLETALESLAELRREGRLIGVISHVAALKERIACQIEVLPGSGGRSVIRGPGVRRL
jgi:exonuclease SbcC